MKFRIGLRVANCQIKNQRMETIRVEFELTGLHALLFRALLQCANMAPGPPLTESELAKALIRSILEDDARCHVPEERATGMSGRLGPRRLGGGGCGAATDGTREEH